jgi:hypothetical protein
MIKLMDLLLEVKLSPEEQEQFDKALAILQDETLEEGIVDKLKKLGLSATVIAALLTSPQLSQAQKSAVGDLKGQTTAVSKDTSKSERTGTDIDGINGLFTSQFEFPTAFLKDLNSGKITNLGFEGNKALQKINESGISVKQMAEWNNYVKWMKSKGYSGNKQMDKKGFSENVLKQYKQENPSFWVKDSNDIKKIQTVLKGYRLYTIGVWKLGVDKAVKSGFQPIGIELTNQEMNPSNSKDIKRVESNYMLWAK